MLSDPEARKRYDSWLKNRNDRIEISDHHVVDSDTINVNISLSRKKINHFLFGQTNIHVNGLLGRLLELGIVVLMSIIGVDWIAGIIFNRLLDIYLMDYAFFEAISKIGMVLLIAALFVIVVSGTAILFKKIINYLFR